jgi:hypothetical protein
VTSASGTARPFWKTPAFWISVCAWLVLVGGHYAGKIPAPWGVVAANAVAAAYAVLRCLAKRREGLPWKGILATSEFAVTSATVLLNLLDSLAQVPSMPPKVLVTISAAAGFLATVLHHLSGTSKTWPVRGSEVSDQALRALVREADAADVRDDPLRDLARVELARVELARVELVRVPGHDVVYVGEAGEVLGFSGAVEKIKLRVPGAPETAASEAETPLERPTVLPK